MNRPKKMKLEASIHSGNYMTSSIHDQNDDEEMPIASPDATNEVPLNDLDHEVDGLVIGGKEASASEAGPSVKDKDAEKMLLGQEAAASSANLAASLISASAAAHQSISGGLTLNKQNASLKNLISYIRCAYSNNLTSPKWKNFKGLKLQVMEKIRLNNVIWRTWFEQYGLKNAHKRKRPLICQFAISLDEPKQAKVDAKIDRSFWKKRLDSITNEYKKWRELSRRQNKLKSSTDDGQVNNRRFRKANKLSRDTDHLDSLAKLYQAANASNNASSASNNSSSHQFATSSSAGAGSSLNGSSNAANSAYSTAGGSFNSANNLGTNSAGVSFSLDSGFSSMASPGRGMGGSASMGSSSFATTSNNASNHHHHHHNPIAHKQMPYRMRSPSPGLFNDIDLYNFSSDTLFSTYCFDDPKDPILGTNPDLFQPDLMHLYPTFDFLDIDIANEPAPKDVVSSNANTAAILRPEADPAVVGIMAPTVKEASAALYMPQEPVAQSQPISLAVEPPSMMGPMQLGSDAQPSQPNGLMATTGQAAMMPVDYNDMADFNTLATVAAAQSINLPTRSRGHGSLKMGPHLTQINTSEPQMGMIQYQATGKPGPSFYETSNSNNGSRIPAMNGSNTIRNLLASKSPLDALGQSSEMLKPQTAPIQQPAQQPVQYLLPNNPPSNSMYNPAKRSMSLNDANRGAKYQREMMVTDEFQAQTMNGYSSIVAPAPPPPPVVHEQQQSVEPPLAKPSAGKMGNKRLPKIANKNPLQSSSAPNPVNAAAVANNVRKVLDSGKPVSSQYAAAAASKKDKLPIASKLTNMNPAGGQNFMYVDPQPQPQHHMNIGSITSESNSNSSLGSPNDMMAGSLPNPYPAPGLVAMSTASASSSSYSSSFSTAAKRNSSETGTKNENPKSRGKVDEYSDLSRAMSRSNSYNSLSALGNADQSLSSAEQKRRCNIQSGFDRLQTLVPSLKDGGKNARASKAAMLLKTSEYIRELQKERDKRLADLDVYKREIEALSDRISDCQNALPASGVSVAGGLNKTELFEQKFNNFIKERTVSDWKYYMFSFILRPLFDNFIGTVNTSSKEQMEKTFHEWQTKYCSITQLRPIVTNALRSMSKSTSIITDPKKLREECISAALTKL